MFGVKNLIFLCVCFNGFVVIELNCYLLSAQYDKKRINKMQTNNVTGKFKVAAITKRDTSASFVRHIQSLIVSPGINHNSVSQLA